MIKKMIPKKIINDNREILRKIVSLFYMGNKYQCNICDFKMSRFIILKNSDVLCPKCGSLARTRQLWSFVKDKIENKTILHFSPPLSLKTKMELIDNIKYITSDYEGEFEAAKKLDIEAINEPSETYDLVICYHVLEHVQNDIQAMKELKRIIKSGGECIIQTPFKEGNIYENAQVKTEEERLIHFGQKDHLRIYSAEGLIKRLESVGFKPELKTLISAENNIHGFSTNEKIIIAKKPVSTQ